MKKIIDARLLLGVTKDSTLSELKNVYRSLMKDWHPDKFTSDESLQKEAEEKSKTIIEAYHFLVSIAPETAQSSLEEYNNSVQLSQIEDYAYKGQTLKVTFTDGSVYEYFDVPKAIYTKFINADSPARFARRHLFHAFVYRNLGRSEVR